MLKSLEELYREISWYVLDYSVQHFVPINVPDQADPLKNILHHDPVIIVLLSRDIPSSSYPQGQSDNTL